MDATISKLIKELSILQSANSEYFIGVQTHMSWHIVLTLGLRRTQVKIGMMNLAYNMKCLVQLIMRDTKVSVRAVCVTNGISAPAMILTREIK